MTKTSRFVKLCEEETVALQKRIKKNPKNIKELLLLELTMDTKIVKSLLRMLVEK